MIDLPEELKPLVNNWPMHLVLVQDINYHLFKDKDNQDIFNGLQRFYQFNGDINELKSLYHSKESTIVLASLLQDKDILNIVKNEEGENIDM